MRIYSNVEIFAANPVVQDYKTTMVHDGDVFRASGFKIETISTPGHSADSVVYRIDHNLFTGDSLTAGLVGATASNYGAMKQAQVLQNKILSLPGNYLVFPSHGPPTTLETERIFNIGISDFENTMRRAERREFNLDFME
jgi:glyoxylase-like metal-dependent hydrolase (beta-lactamase superfamily II)